MGVVILGLCYVVTLTKMVVRSHGCFDIDEVTSQDDHKPHEPSFLIRGAHLPSGSSHCGIHISHRLNV